MKEIEIDCPCCEARLLIDVRTQTVLRHTKRAELDEFGKPSKDGSRWDAAQKKIADASGRGDDAFDAALSREKGREQDLDDLFKRAKTKIDRRKAELDED